MAVEIISATYNGLDSKLITVEVEITKGIPSLYIVGLPDSSVRESKERVRSAIINSGYKFPLGRITINLAPANIKKVGSLLDLPIALGILMASNQLKDVNIHNKIFVGELSLNGDLKAIKGAVPIVLEKSKKKKYKYIIPYENLEEVRFFSKGDVYPFDKLTNVIKYMSFDKGKGIEGDLKNIKIDENSTLDFGDIIGQKTSKRAMEIVAAGRHNIILYGAPGSGKTMLAKALKSILPPLTIKELEEVARIRSISGVEEKDGYFDIPFRNPHHTLTKGALLGGGNDIKLGEVTLAHNGILFLDELLEFKKEVIEVLREPLEEGNIHITRVNSKYELPANFILVGAFNPCKCGKMLNNYNLGGCTCTEYEREKYISKLSKAFLDRVDIINYTPKLEYKEILNSKDKINSKYLRERVLLAIEMQEYRYKDLVYNRNSELKGKEVFAYCNIDGEANYFLEEYYNKNKYISLRGYTKVIKLSRTIADLEGEEKIKSHHIIEALGYRKHVNGEII